MYICSKCDAQSQKWAGRCLTCGGWGTLAEETKRVREEVATSKAANVEDLAGATDAVLARHAFGISEFDRVLGGGIVPGSLVLLSGEPGMGKSTLAALAAGALGKAGTVLYASGEESKNQLAGRLKRLSVPLDHVGFVGSTRVEEVAKAIEKSAPPLAIVDSVQTLSSSTVENEPGSVTLVRYATNVLLETAKRTGVPILLIGQVTKDGAVAGPKTLEHLVDVVLVLEGEAGHAARFLRATKNRFGSTDEVGVFEMQESGLVGVENPSAYFLNERSRASGSIITPVLEGSRVFLVEVQALVERTVFGNPLRRASGFDERRLLMLCAILSRRAGLKLADQDVYINVVGGLRLDEPAADLAVCLAIASAMDKIKLDEKTVVFGEVGLGGEIRRVPASDRRLKESTRLGFDHAISPDTKKSLNECF